MTDLSGQPSLSRNVAVTMGGRIVYLASRVALPPIILSYIGLEEYGIWASCFVLIGYLGMSAFGVANVYIRYVADYHARGDTERINRLVSTGVMVTGALGVLILAGLWLALPGIIHLFKISPALADKAFVLLFATCATFVLDLSLGAFAQVLIGLQRIGEQTLVWVATSVLEAVLIVVFLAAGFGVYALLIAFAVRFLVAIVANAMLCRRALPGLAIRLAYIDRSVLRLFYGFGAVVQVAGLLGIALYSIEKVIAGVFIGATATGLFDVGEKFPVMVSGIPSSANAALLPAISRLHALDQGDAARRLYVEASRYISMLGGLLMGYLAAFAGAVIVFWLGPAEEYRVAAFILLVFTPAFHLHVVTGPASALYRGVGQPLHELVYPLTQTLLVLVGVGFGFATVGRTIEVIAVAVAGSMIVSAAVYEAYTNRRLKVPQWEYFRRVWVPGLLPYGFGFALAAGLRPWLGGVPAGRWEACGVLAVGGVLYAVVTAVVLYRFVCDAGERDRIRQQGLQALGRVLPRRWLPAPDRAGAGGSVPRA